MRTGGGDVEKSCLNGNCVRNERIGFLGRRGKTLLSKFYPSARDNLKDFRCPGPGIVGQPDLVNLATFDYLLTAAGANLIKNKLPGFYAGRPQNGIRGYLRVTSRTRVRIHRRSEGCDECGRLSFRPYPSASFHRLAFHWRREK